MKTDALNALTAQLARPPASLTIVDSPADFGAKLTLGQIIKGKVLRSYDGQRHRVDFDGQERVVDSSVPLRAGETFRGRVVAIGDRVELQKLPPEAGEAVAPDLGAADRGNARRGDPLLRDLIARYGAGIDAQVLEQVQLAAARQPDVRAAVLAGLVLAKQGLPVSADAMRLLLIDLRPAERPDGRAAVYLETLAAPVAVPFGSTAAGEPSTTASTRPSTETAAAPVTTPVTTLPALGMLLQQLLIELPSARNERTARDGDAAPTLGSGERDPSSNPALAAWILNGQTAGPIAHRLGMLQLVVDGRLLELEIAVFEEAGPRDDSVPDDRSTRHRQIVLSLDTDGLGRIDVNARMAGQHLQVQLAAASSEATGRLARHSHALEQDLRGLGWTLDGLAYETHADAAGRSPRTVVVEHIVNPGSVSRLV